MSSFISSSIGSCPSRGRSVSSRQGSRLMSDQSGNTPQHGGPLQYVSPGGVSQSTKGSVGSVCSRKSQGQEVTSKEKPPSMAKGGMVKKTGLHKLHKGEMVIPVKDVAKVKKALKSAK